MANNGHTSSRTPLKTPVAYKDKKFPNMLRIKFEEGGKVPEVLAGSYNKIVEAEKAISDWIIGYTRDKIYPSAPANDIPQKLAIKPKEDEKVLKNGEEKGISRV